MKPNFNSVFKKFSYKIHQFGKIRKFLDIPTRILVYKQTVLLLTEYVSFVLCLNTKNEVDKLQKLQNRALRMCYNIYNPRDISIAQLHTMANVYMLYKRRMLQLLCLFMISHQGQSKTELYYIILNWQTKTILNLNLPMLNYIPNHLTVSGVKFWNDLPKEIQDLKSKNKFKSAISDII